MQITFTQRVVAEFIGTALLLAIITGSGIMGDTLSAGNAAVALLGNSIATGCGLYVLISLLGPISGAHFNPAVSLVSWRHGELTLTQTLSYIGMQVTGAVVGVWLTHVIFGMDVLQTSTHDRSGLHQMLSELVSTLVLLSVIKIGVKNTPEKIPMLVALTVTAGYWFTSSTFFANPAVTVARSLTDTFVGIAPVDIAGFISAQLAAVLLMSLLIGKNK
ncbi:aquaporin [Methylotenera mobilis]|uniref:Major intrinsic protein n=1 Tax=Methylotenera mobilis (strain JLW8 / ATCC BAA-1282 / DSM 17540) TaxID=583345 RepID=C6WXR4_METML|nr:MIP/aquaporin family protein [Methylotenera mobilis]ACT48713.1 major intrinsic protein [Methylotenera mobilis JLW8]